MPTDVGNVVVILLFVVPGVVYPARGRRCCGVPGSKRVRYCEIR